MIEDRDDFAQYLQRGLHRILVEGEEIELVLSDYPQYAERLRPPLEAAIWLRDHRIQFDPDPAYLESSRERLIRKIKGG